MDIALLLGCLFACFALGVPIAYSLGLAAIAGALWIGVPLEAVMLKISDGVSKVAMLTIVLTFFGAAACYRLRLHMNVTLVVNPLPARARRVADFAVELLMAAIALFMLVWGTSLVEATWHNTIADFPFLSTGVTYLPIPIGGAILFLFVIEHLTLGRPKDVVGGSEAPAAFE